MELKKRLEQFKKLEYEFHKEFYQELTKGQHPHTLFIGCSDSRIDAKTLFQAEAGEIFQIRNVANIVPRADEQTPHPSSLAALEYAVKILKVENVIVCGHSTCGGCAALRKMDHYLEELPHTMDWISQSLAISEYIDIKYPDLPEERKIIKLEKLNVVQQLDNLMTYDFLREKVEAGEINLQGYYYDIGTGTVSVYDYVSEFSDLLKEIAAFKEQM
ncbi:MAG: carbonic anhydrase [Actinomycetaceae bacterium]|nr:carbonic anhydrase [Actinomycetaceae bacterium]